VRSHQSSCACTQCCPTAKRIAREDLLARSRGALITQPPGKSTGVVEVAAEAPGVVRLRLPGGHFAMKPREGSDGTAVAITVQWILAWRASAAQGFLMSFPLRFLLYERG
jgi:hypothetical protein